ncbi:MAG: CBS domain-containing protein [Synechococcales bacterium]|nr:CBS domain-containing protein [Synechococcales bacterium]
MDLVLCHTTADFDTLGAAVGVTRLYPGTRLVLTGGSHPTVKDFLALHRDEYALIERRSVSPEQIQSLTVVDTQWRDRLGSAQEWLDLPGVEITLYDHHPSGTGDIAAHHRQVEPVGATVTLIAERLQQRCILLSPVEATVMALGIHADTGSLTFDHTTVRDAAALTWLMGQGASPRAISEYATPGLSPQLQDLLALTLDTVKTQEIEGLSLSWVLLELEDYVAGLSSLASQAMTLTESDLFLLVAYHPSGGDRYRVTVIGRSRGAGFGTSHLEAVDLGKVLASIGGGGHARAAAATLKHDHPQQLLDQLLQQIQAQVPPPPTARDLMSSPVRTVRPQTTIGEAQRILLRYGHSGLSVVDEGDRLVGVISRRDIDIALHHDFSHAPVKGFMTTRLKTITPDTPLPDIESLMVTYDIGRLPVLDGEDLVGIVTRTDVLRQLHQAQVAADEQRSLGGRSRRHCPLPQTVLAMLGDRLDPALWRLLQATAAQAERRGWQIYLVGGAVRDLLLAEAGAALMIDDIDLVVDGFHRAADDAAGVELARALQESYPNARLQTHGRFQTAALLWHHDPELDSLWIDIATARTEFYPYPAANPEVEASSIRQDLYRRDFTINALAIRLTAPRSGELLDFFGGLLDLEAQQIRVLHANSFIEDPTRIFRAVRFAVRLGFEIESQTQDYIRHAIASGIYHRVQVEMDATPALQTRLKRELRYILEAPYWRSAIRLLDDLNALQCIHPTLRLTPHLGRQLRLADRLLRRVDGAADAQTVPPHWEILLETLLAQLPAADRAQVAETLQLAADSIDRLRHLHQTEAAVHADLAQVEKPSGLYHHLQGYDAATLILLGVRSDRPTRRKIWHYLTRLSQVKPPLDGNDLKRLGYKPGRQYREILDALLAATLDGEVGDRASAEQFVKTQWAN